MTAPVSSTWGISTTQKASETQISGPSSGSRISVGMCWSVRICISNKLPGGADADDQGPQFENLIVEEFFLQ